MKVKLKCPENKFDEIRAILEIKGFELDDDSPVTFSDECILSASEDVSIVFNPDDLASLERFIDDIRNLRPIKADSNHVIGKIDERFEIVALSDVLYFHAIGNDVYCETARNRYEVPKKLYEIEENLRDKGYIRISKSIVMNIMKVAEIIPWFGGKLLLRIRDRKEEFEVSRNYVQNFKRYLGF